VLLQECTDWTFEPDYNVDGVRLHRLGGEPYEGGAWVTVAPGETMTRHVNPDGESEIFFIFGGTGVFEVATETRRVAPGVSLLVPPGRAHSLRNDGDGPLRLLALWWGAVAAPTAP
jgi:mannose-6-phosphate isomerase-like protein (cupin superfamily)